jgi:hypothetical protein
MRSNRHIIAHLTSLLGWGIGFPLLAHAVQVPSWWEMAAGLLILAAFQGGALFLFCLNRQTAA